MSRIEAIRRRLEAATPGPWKASPDLWSGVPEIYGQHDAVTPLGFRVFFKAEDRDLVAHAPQDLRDLLVVVEEARSFVQQTTVSDPEDVWDRLTMDIAAYKKLKAACSRLDAEVEGA